MILPPCSSTDVALRTILFLFEQSVEEQGGRIILIVHHDDPPTLLLNRCRAQNNSLSIRTIGMKSNRDGIGARVTLVAGGHRQVGEVRSGGGVPFSKDLRVRFWPREGF